MSDQDDELYSFEDDAKDASSKETEDTGVIPWKILMVDDSPEVHQVTRFVLRSMHFLGRPVEFISGYSAMEGRQLILEHPDAAVILLDVVMETDSAGLDMVKFIREDAGNRLIRIILRTGQPGQAPEAEVIQRYDINDYKNKAELSDDRLHTSVILALRSYERLHNEFIKRQASERTIEYLAYYDVWTGLPNRTLLLDRISQVVQSAVRHNWNAAVLYIDLDQFKRINDSLGHEIGDLLLKTVAERLRILVRGEDTVAHVSGDEFAILLPNLKDPEHSARVAEKALAAIQQPYQIEGQELHITASIGISVCPNDGSEGLTLIRNADTAMYQSKASGRNTYSFFKPEMTARALENLRVSNDLRRAIARNEFVLHYQPQVDLQTGRIVGAEALIRWQHPEWGLVFPGKFIGVAEETGLIQPMGEWVLREACRQNKAWQTAGLPPIDMAVNLSARQFDCGRIERVTTEALAETGLEAHHLELEVTESMIMQNVDQAIAVMKMLKTIGVKLSIDDFGTGYSSLNYLKRFPLDKLKIDQTFVRDIGIDEDDASIVTAIIGLAKSLKLKVIAEGVEKEMQLNFLRDGGCDEMQGYYFSKPIPAADFEALVRKSLVT
ncbi:MAG: EAL domain-containing protein [Burkholderiales bacterium]|nr:EAL domain-containing protein [Burkholderiales bacterium]